MVADYDNGYHQVRGRVARRGKDGPGTGEFNCTVLCAGRSMVRYSTSVLYSTVAMHTTGVFIEVHPTVFVRKLPTPLKNSPQV